MTSKLLKVIGVGVAASATSLLAGDFTPSSIAPASSGGGLGNWSKSLKDMGTVYKNKENPWLQEVKFFGRAHYQYGYVDGDVNGAEFDGGGDELRRLRFGSSIKFLNGFKATGRANFSQGSFRNPSIGYNGWDELYLQYSFDKDFGPVEDLTIGYGRYKVGFGGEETTSSKKIKTIERSNLNNTYAGGRATGLKIDFDLGEVSYGLGVFSSGETNGDDPVFADWDGKVAYVLSAEFEGLGGDVLLQGLYNDITKAESLVAGDDVFGYRWAVSATHDTKVGPFDLFTNITYGEDHDGDATYGVVIMPSIDLIEDKLEAVVRYQYMKAEGNASFKGTKRYLERVANHQGVIDPNGNENHTIYAGLNYFISDHNLKLMTGVEYETVEGGTADSDSTTVWGAVRFYF